MVATAWPCAPLRALRWGKAARKPEGLTALEQPIQWTNKKPRSVQPWLRTGVFHGAASFGMRRWGAMAAWAMESLAWLTQQTMALRPLWTLTHVAILAWGLMMLIAVATAGLDRNRRAVQSGGVFSRCLVRQQVWPVLALCGHSCRAVCLFGLAGGGAQRRAFAGCLDHGAVCCGQRSLARGRPLGLAVDTAAFGLTAGWLRHAHQSCSPRCRCVGVVDGFGIQALALVPLRCSSGLRPQRFQEPSVSKGDRAH